MLIRSALLVVVSFVAGALAMFGFLNIGLSNSQWFQLDIPSASSILLTDAAVESDISLPDITTINGKAKFLPASSSTNARTLGYIVHIIVSPLDLRKVPKKYLEDKTVGVINGAPVTSLPIKQVYYTVTLAFELKDKDGFTLATVSGPPELIASGKDNILQNTVSTLISSDVVGQTKLISGTLTLDTCNTCESE